MRILLLLLSLGLLLSATHIPTGPELDARLSTPTYQTWNCDPAGGAATVPVRVFISNPYLTTMSINFSYYDFPSQEMKPYGRACVLPAHTNDYCTLQVPVSLGGEGTGNASITLSIYGTVEGSREEPERTLSFTLLHQPPSTETSQANAISQAENLLSSQQLTFESHCSNGACCGMQQAHLFLEAASRELSDSRQLLRECNLAGARKHTDTALLEVSDAQARYNLDMQSCDASLQTYSQAQGNMSAANKTISRRAVCGVDVSASRSQLYSALSLLQNASSQLAQDDYASAQAMSRQASDHSISALMASGDCPIATGQSQLATGNSTAPSAPPGTNYTTILLSYAGYILLIVLLFVVGVVLYITISNRAPPVPFDSGSPISAQGGSTPLVRDRPNPHGPPKSPSPEEGKVDEEFEKWLKEQEKSAKSKDKKKKK